MDVRQIVGEKYNWKNSAQYRMLTSDAVEGPISSGFHMKTRYSGNHKDIVTKEYHGLLIISGHGIYKDEHGEIPLGPGDFVQRLPDVTHSTYATDDEWNELYVVMGRTMYKHLVKLNVLTDYTPVLHPGLDFYMIECFMKLHDQMSYADRLSLALIPAKMIDFLSYITYMHRIHQTAHQSDQALAIAMQYMKDHQHTRVSVQEVAEHVNMGYEKFRKLFQNHYGVSPGNYMIHKRINTAQQLLSTGAYSVKEISAQLGYIDIFTFSKQFKKVTGRTPSEFKDLFLQ